MTGQAAARAAFMDAQPGDAYSSDDEGAAPSKLKQSGTLGPSPSDGSFTSSTGAGLQQRFKVRPNASCVALRAAVC